MIHFVKTFPFLIVLLVSYGCGMLGPSSLKEGRNRYNQVIAYTGNEQMLINLVKLRYRDSPTFLQVSSISTNLQWGASASAQVPIGSSLYSAGNLVPFGAGFNYAESPTITYTPLTGEAFVRQMLTPIPLQTLILLFQAGWPVDTVFRLVVQEVNDLENASPASGPTPEREPIFHKFLEVASIFRDLQKRRVIEWGVTDKGWEGVMYVHPHLSTEEKKNVTRLKTLLKLKRLQMDMEQYEVGYGVCFTDSSRLNMVTRSMTDILFYIAQAVEVPPEHMEKKLVTITRTPEGKVFNWETLHKKQISIKWSDSRPDDAYIAVKYRSYWFYIADSDLDSKSTFLLLQILGDLQAGTTPSAGPVLTLPVARQFLVYLDMGFWQRFKQGCRVPGAVCSSSCRAAEIVVEESHNFANWKFTKKFLLKQISPGMLQHLSAFGTQKTPWIEKILLSMIFDMYRIFQP